MENFENLFVSGNVCSVVLGNALSACDGFMDGFMLADVNGEVLTVLEGDSDGDVILVGDVEVAVDGDVEVLMVGNAEVAVEGDVEV